jgi:hypothetical protein
VRLDDRRDVRLSAGVLPRRVYLRGGHDLRTWPALHWQTRVDDLRRAGQGTVDVRSDGLPPGGRRRRRSVRTRPLSRSPAGSGDPLKDSTAVGPRGNVQPSRRGSRSGPLVHLVPGRACHPDTTRAPRRGVRLGPGPVERCREVSTHNRASRRLGQREGYPCVADRQLHQRSIRLSDEATVGEDPAVMDVAHSS